MEPYGGPAALGGVVTGLMLAAWMLGRWPGALAPTATSDEREPSGVQPFEREHGYPAAPARACQQAARDERRAAFEGEAYLGELHADMSAYRRAQQVFSDTELTRSILIGKSTSGEEQPCRYLGVSGQPTCPSPHAADAPCACDLCDTDGLAPPPLAAQPSVWPGAAAVFTRV